MKTNRQSGFTLVELMVVIALFGLMAAIAFPNLSQFVANTRITNRAEQLANLFRFAKGEAVRLNAPVIVCGVGIRKDGRHDGTCSDVDSAGWFAYADLDRDGSYTSGKDLDLRTISLDGTTEQHNDASKKKVKLEVDFANIAGTPLKAADKQFIYMPNGTFGRKTGNNLSSVTIGDSYVRFTLTNLENKKNLTRDMVLTPSGTPTVCSGWNDKNTVDKNKNVHLNCS